MVPLFKSDFSIGKSILRLDKKSVELNSETSIFSILLENNIKKLVLVEDNMTGFLEAYNNCKSFDIDLIFGLKISIHDETSDCFHKLIIFSKNKDGCIDLNILSTRLNTLDRNFNLHDLADVWTENLVIYVPFYDSFIHKNLFSFCAMMPDFNFCRPIFFIESNDLPFDSMIQEGVTHYCKVNNFSMIRAKSIYYKSRGQFSAFQTYKCICSRSYSGANTSLDCPNIDHLSSSSFCFESYLEKSSAKSYTNKLA